MTCTKCKCKMLVVDVRSDATTTARKLQCPRCKIQAYTKETEDGGHDAFKELKKYVDVKRKMRAAKETQKYEQLKIEI